MNEQQIVFTTEEAETAHILLNFLVAQSEKETSREKILGPTRGAQTTCDFRYIYFNLLKDIFPGFSQKKIGKIVGGRDHSTVISGLAKNPLTPQKHKELLELFLSLTPTEKERYQSSVIDTPPKIVLFHGAKKQVPLEESVVQKDVKDKAQAVVDLFKRVVTEMQVNSDHFGTSLLFADSLASDFGLFLERNFAIPLNEAVSKYLDKRIPNLPVEERDDFLSRFSVAELLS